jgi:general L-amino acid transport system substrate-binding protein
MIHGLARVLLLLLPLLLPGPAAAGQDLERIRSKQYLSCGVAVAVPGFGMVGPDGIWRGFDIDFCRAIATALFGDPTKIRFVPLLNEERWSALRSQRIDVLLRQTSFSAGRDSALGLRLVTPNYHDGHTFLVPTGAGDDLQALAGRRICLVEGSSNVVITRDVLQTAGISYTEVALPRLADMAVALEDGRCDAAGYEGGALAVLRGMLARPEAFAILPGRYSREATGPVIRAGDDEWFDVNRWVIMALIEAEELGVTSENVEVMRRSSAAPAVRKLLGDDGEIGKALGLPGRWAYTMIRTTGNWQEIFARNLGDRSPLKLERGANRLWRDGGLLYAWPLR